MQVLNVALVVLGADLLVTVGTAAVQVTLTVRDSSIFCLFFFFLTNPSRLLLTVYRFISF